MDKKTDGKKTPQIFTISPVLTKFFTLNTDGPVQWLKGVKQLICSSPTTFRKNIPGWVVTLFNGTYSTILLTTSGLMLLSTLWQYRLWSFQAGVTKLERFLPMNQHTQTTFWELEQWEGGKMCQNLTFKVNFLHQKSLESFSNYFALRNTILGVFFCYWIFFIKSFFKSIYVFN